MSDATERAKEKYEKRLTIPLLSEEAMILLDPYSFTIEQAYYEHGFDRLTFVIDTLKYSIPACLPTLPTLYFVGFARPAASEIFAKFQTSPINKKPHFRFRMIARTHLQQRGRNIRAGLVQPKTTREALDYIGISDEAQTKVLKLHFLPDDEPLEFMLRQITMDFVTEWVLRYFDRRINILANLDCEIKRREITGNSGSVVPVNMKFLADELENKCMDSGLAYGHGAMNMLPLTLITDP